jgi:hypothetical protein
MTSYLPIILLLAVAVIGIPIWLKKRKGKTASVVITKRKDKDEV